MRPRLRLTIKIKVQIRSTLPNQNLTRLHATETPTLLVTPGLVAPVSCVPGPCPTNSVSGVSRKGRCCRPECRDEHEFTHVIRYRGSARAVQRRSLPLTPQFIIHWKHDNLNTDDALLNASTNQKGLRCFDHCSFQ